MHGLLEQDVRFAPEHEVSDIARTELSQRDVVHDGDVLEPLKPAPDPGHIIGGNLTTEERVVVGEP